MKEILYFSEVNNQIICTNYFGRNLENKRKYPLKSFELTHSVKGISLNGKKLYVMLSNELVIIVKNISMLKHEMFKGLVHELRFKYVKYHLKTLRNNANFYARKTLSQPQIISPVIPLIIASAIGLSNITNYDKELMKLETLSDIEINSYIENYIENNSSDEVAIEDVIKETIYMPSTLDDTFDDVEIIEEPIMLNIDDYPIYEDTVAQETAIVDNRYFYAGDVYDNLVKVMNDEKKTAEMNETIQEYISSNLDGVMWANAKNLDYDEYTIPEKYKNGQFTLDELFTDAAATFEVPKDVLVAVSQHECGQSYYPLNSYTLEYEKNYGGMMGYLNIYKLNANHLPQGGYDGCDINTNPAIPVFAYASTVRFYYDNFKNIDIGNGLDAWDFSLALHAIGPGDVSDINVGYKYRSDYERKGWSQLNICAPQFKSLREAYLNNKLGVNDLTFTVENGVVTHWTDSELYYYQNGEINVKKTDEQTLVLQK